MTGNAPDLCALAELARKYDAILYVDDAHGFGVVGERSYDELSPYGTSGNSIVRHLGETYDNVVLVAGLSKSYSSLAAFIACPTELKRLLKTAAPPYLYSGPSPIASLATTIAGLDVNERRGDAIRAELWAKTDRVLRALDELGIHTPNHSGFPIIEVPLAKPDDIGALGRFLFDARDLRDAGRLSARSEERGRLPASADCRQHRRRDRPVGRGAREARERLRPAAARRGRRA